MISIETIVEDARWSAAVADIEARAARAFEAARAREPRISADTALLLADDAMLRDLNLRFRGQDKATNVLSFPSGEYETLGDIAIAFETALRESGEKGIALADHAVHLIVHGLLHLAGHDHEETREARRMEALEVEILGALGVENPYTDAEEAD